MLAGAFTTFVAVIELPGTVWLLDALTNAGSVVTNGLPERRVGSWNQRMFNSCMHSPLVLE